MNIYYDIDGVIDLFTGDAVIYKFSASYFSYFIRWLDFLLQFKHTMGIGIQ